MGTEIKSYDSVDEKQKLLYISSVYKSFEIYDLSLSQSVMVSVMVTNGKITWHASCTLCALTKKSFCLFAPPLIGFRTVLKTIFPGSQQATNVGKMYKIWVMTGLWPRKQSFCKKKTYEFTELITLLFYKLTIVSVRLFRGP